MHMGVECNRIERSVGPCSVAEPVFLITGRYYIASMTMSVSTRLQRRRQGEAHSSQPILSDCLVLSRERGNGYWELLLGII